MSVVEGTPITAAMNYLWDSVLTVAQREMLCAMALDNTSNSRDAWTEIPLADRYQIIVAWQKLRRFVNENEGAFDKIRELRNGTQG